jgi:ferric-dicitrate binding protein FerR (iron transport regulator)
MFRASSLRFTALGVSSIVAMCTLAAQAQDSSIAAVRAIHRGLTVQPHSKAPGQGKVGQKLFTADQLQTKVLQRASVGFVDRTVLDMNQRTSLILVSPHLIRLTHGEVAPIDVPASHLQIQTAAATSSAIGTHFDVWITPKLGPYGQVPKGYRKDQMIKPAGTTTVSVVAGLVKVSTAYGSVTVKAGQWTHVRPGQAPTTPNGHNARQDIAWTSSLHR